MVRASRASQSPLATSDGRPQGEQGQAAPHRAGLDDAELDQRGAAALQAAEIEAATIVRKAEEAAERAAEVRRDLDEEVRAVTAEIRQLRGDLERREERIAEREQRLDEEAGRLDQQASSVDEVRGQLDKRRGRRSMSWTRSGKPSWSGSPG